MDTSAFHSLINTLSMCGRCVAQRCCGDNGQYCHFIFCIYRSFYVAIERAYDHPWWSMPPNLWHVYADSLLQCRNNPYLTIMLSHVVLQYLSWPIQLIAGKPNRHIWQVAITPSSLLSPTPFYFSIEILVCAFLYASSFDWLYKSGCYPLSLG